MRAAFCTGRGQVELRDVPEPRPQPGEVVVRVHACGICGSDLHYYTGAANPPPFCLGHELSGRVGSPGGRLAVDDPCVVEPQISCGACARCRAGEPNLCPQVRILGSMAPGGFADAVVVPTACVYPLPEGVDLDLAMLAEPLAVGVHAVRLAGASPDDKVLIIGAGPIGLLTAFAAARHGMNVTVSARHPHQRAAAEALGAAGVIGATPDDVRHVTAADPPDVVFETVGGTGPTFDLALEVVRPGGRIVALGKFTRPITLAPLRFLMKEIRLTSSMTYRRGDPEPDFATALALLAAEASRLAPLITHRVPLAEIARGFALAADKSSGAIKVAVDVARA